MFHAFAQQPQRRLAVDFGPEGLGPRNIMRWLFGGVERSKLLTVAGCR